MRPGPALALAIAATLTWAAPARSTARDRTYVAGADGWRLERFGSDVAILRTVVSRLPDSGAGAGSLLLSCEGDERRLRLSLPEGLPELEGATVGRALVRPAVGGRSQDVVVARLSLVGGRLLAANDTGGLGGDAVLRVARLLQARPIGLEWLVVAGIGPVVPRRLVPIILALAFQPSEGVVLDDFVSACRPARR